MPNTKEKLTFQEIQDFKSFFSNALWNLDYEDFKKRYLHTNPNASEGRVKSKFDSFRTLGDTLTYFDAETLQVVLNGIPKDIENYSFEMGYVDFKKGSYVIRKDAKESRDFRFYEVLSFVAPEDSSHQGSLLLKGDGVHSDASLYRLVTDKEKIERALKTKTF